MGCCGRRIWSPAPRVPPGRTPPRSRDPSPSGPSGSYSPRGRSEVALGRRADRRAGHQVAIDERVALGRVRSRPVAAPHDAGQWSLDCAEAAARDRHAQGAVVGQPFPWPDDELAETLGGTGYAPRWEGSGTVAVRVPEPAYGPAVAGIATGKTG